MPKRLGWTILTIGVGLLMSAAIIMYLAFSAGPDAPSRLQSSHVQNEGTVSWSEDGGTTVQAGSLQDALFLLGYGHARSRSWQLALWRQAALGRLAEWFGPDALPADRLVRQLGIPDGARETWDQLDPDTRALMSSYTAGLDRAMSAPDLNRGAPFLILDIEAETWEGWHSVAVERLFVWLSSSDRTMDGPSAPAFFSEADRLLEQLLSFHGTKVNFAAGINHGGEPYLASRLATGASGIPFYSESELDYGSGRFTGVMVPGALIPLMGRTHVDAWALTGRSVRSIESRVVPAEDIVTRFHRIRHAGEEEVVAAHHWGPRLILDPPPRTGENRSIRVLSWTGDSRGSDADVWLNALAGTTPSPRLLSGDGVQWSGVGFSVTGNPDNVLNTDPEILFVTSASERSSPVATIASLSETPALQVWMNLKLSRAATDLLNPILQSLEDSLLTNRQQREAVRYLQNWNLEYGAAEPGASILETFLATTADSAVGGARIRASLNATVDLLSRQYGPDMSSWRWETIQERTVNFPGSSSRTADGGRTEERFLDKYHPVKIRAPGHPQSLVWGSPPSSDSMRVTSAWEGALSLREGTLHFRRPVVDFNRFLGTFLTGDRPPELRTLRRSAPDASTTFLPRR
jgi:hypothetical protein